MVFSYLKKHWTVVVLVVVLLAIVASSYFYSKKDTAQSVLGDKDVSESSSEDPTQQESTKVVVDVSGAVSSPGIYSVDSTFRVGEVIKLAGGCINRSSLDYISKNINLAEKITDGLKIYVPFEWDLYSEDDVVVTTLVINKPIAQTVNNQPGSSANTTNTESRNNINTMSLDELDALPGIGPSYAQRIIDNRSYKNFDELVSKSKVPETTLQKIKASISY